MKYLCLIYTDEKALQAMPAPEYDAIVTAQVAYADELRASGHFVAGQALQPTHTATTVRVRDERASLTDGPFAETREQLAGFVMVEARDLNEAIQLAARIPLARLGSIEVRPTFECGEHAREAAARAAATQQA